MPPLPGFESFGGGRVSCTPEFHVLRCGHTVRTRHDSRCSVKCATPRFGEKRIHPPACAACNTFNSHGALLDGLRAIDPYQRAVNWVRALKLSPSAALRWPLGRWLEELEDIVDDKMYNLHRRVGSRAWEEFERMGRAAFEQQVEDTREMEEARLDAGELEYANIVHRYHRRLMQEEITRQMEAMEAEVEQYRQRLAAASARRRERLLAAAAEQRERLSEDAAQLRAEFIEQSSRLYPNSTEEELVAMADAVDFHQIAEDVLSAVWFNDDGSAVGEFVRSLTQ